MCDSDLLDLENVACPGAGACGGQYTANTMSTVMELIGLSPMGFNGVPAMDSRKDQVAFRCGEIVLNALKRGIRPKDILVHEAFENAIAGVPVKRAWRWRWTIFRKSASGLPCSLI